MGTYTKYGFGFGGFRVYDWGGGLEFFVGGGGGGCPESLEFLQVCKKGSIECQQLLVGFYKGGLLG